MIRRPPRSTLFPTRRSSDLQPDDQSGQLGGPDCGRVEHGGQGRRQDRKSTRLNSSHMSISYAVFCLKKKKKKNKRTKEKRTINHHNKPTCHYISTTTTKSQH